MMLNTKCHGEISYTEDEIIYFQKGILGFDELKKFIIFSLKDNDVCSVIHSIEDENVGFIVTSPFMVDREYEFELSELQEKLLKIKRPEDVEVVNIITINSDLNNITINLRAPIIINKKEKVGEQIVLNSDKYKIKTPIIGEKKNVSC